MSQSVNFLKVNCENKNICNFYDIKRYPTIKVFYNGDELNDEPARDLNGLLGFAQKLSQPSLEELKKENISEYKETKANEMVLIYNDENSELYKCTQNIVENKFKLSFYVKTIKKTKANLELLNSNDVLSKKEFIENEALIVFIS